MSNKKRSLNSSSRDNIKNSRDSTCQLCGRERENLFLECHHINGNKHDNSDKNILILCGKDTKEKCHETLEKQIAITRQTAYIEFASGERVKNKTELIKHYVDYSSGSVEMQANEHAEMPYRNWLIALLKNVNLISRKQAIYSGAEIAGISPLTARRYYNKLVSDLGPLIEYKDEFKRWMVKIRK